MNYNKLLKAHRYNVFFYPVTYMMISCASMLHQKKSQHAFVFYAMLEPVYVSGLILT